MHSRRGRTGHGRARRRAPYSPIPWSVQPPERRCARFMLLPYCRQVFIAVEARIRTYSVSMSRPLTSVLLLGQAVALGAVAFSGTALAETLVMPYRCTIAGGRPVLVRSDQTGHAINGKREERSFTACAPSDATRCQTWKLYRFKMDCAGREVSWAEVAADAPQAERWGAWYGSGRISFRLPQSWGLAPDDPCSRTTDWDDRRLRRYCADRQDLTPRQVIELPPDFAPMFDLDGIFVADKPPVKAAPTVAKGAVKILPKNQSVPGPSVQIQPKIIAPPKEPSASEQKGGGSQSVADVGTAESPSLRSAITDIPGVFVGAGSKVPEAKVSALAAAPARPAVEPPPEPPATDRVARAEATANVGSVPAPVMSTDPEPRSSLFSILPPSSSTGLMVIGGIAVSLAAAGVVISRRRGGGGAVPMRDLSAISLHSSVASEIRQSGGTDTLGQLSPGTELVRPRKA